MEATAHAVGYPSEHAFNRAFSATGAAARPRPARRPASRGDAIGIVAVAGGAPRRVIERGRSVSRVGRSSQTVKSAGRFLFRVLLDRRGRARLVRARVLGLTVRMTVTAPGAMPQRATRKPDAHAPARARAASGPNPPAP